MPVFHVSARSLACQRPGRSLRIQDRQAEVAHLDRGGQGDVLEEGRAVHHERPIHRAVRGPEQAMEGEGRPRNVVIEFPSLEAAVDCYNSPEYQAALVLRQKFSVAHFAIVEGA